MPRQWVPSTPPPLGHLCWEEAWEEHVHGLGAGHDVVVHERLALKEVRASASHGG
jgi:hypothetical protein